MTSFTRSGLVVLFFCVFGVWTYGASTFRPAKNFHEVDPGRFYRSAQLTGAEFEDVAATHHVKTVINLRGSQPGEPWYDEEAKTLERLGVKLINLGFASGETQSPELWQQYLDALKTAERPILVHCRSGADRTGEASAIYAYDYMKADRESALQQLSFRYLHVGAFKPAKRAFVREYRGPNWLAKYYNPCSRALRLYARDGMCLPEAN